MASKLVRLPCVDEDGYFCDFKMVMETPDGELLLPDDVAQIDAPVEDPAAAPSFYRLSDDKSSWIEEPKPKTAQECVAMGAVSHQSQTQRCNELRQLFQKLTEGSTTHRIARGPDLEWIVEKIPEKTVDELKEEKKRELDGAFTAWRGEAATLKSSLGFEADSDDRAKTDVGALVEALEAQNAYTAAGVEFMDANNVKHPLNLEQLQVLNQEIITAGLAAYDYKWKTRDEIDDAKTKEDLAKIKIKFVPVDFTAA